jgi:hypothetical protein
MEIPSSNAGVVKEINVAVGDKVKEGWLVKGPGCEVILVDAKCVSTGDRAQCQGSKQTLKNFAIH